MKLSTKELDILLEDLDDSEGNTEPIFKRDVVPFYNQPKLKQFIYGSFLVFLGAFFHALLYEKMQSECLTPNIPTAPIPAIPNSQTLDPISEVNTTPQDTQRTAVVTYAFKIPAWHLFIFIFSHREHLDPAKHDIVILGTSRDKQWDDWMIQFADTFNVTFVDTTTIRENSDWKEAYDKFPFGSWHLNSKRFMLWKYWVDRNWHQYRAIMLSDATDVIFNQNIFDDVPQDGKEYQFFFLEDSRKNISDMKLSMDYLKWCCTEKEIRIVSPNPSACAGTILGTSFSIHKYLELQVEYHLNRGDHCLAYGGDQGLHNLILRKHLLQKKYGVIEKVIDNNPDGDGLVLSMTIMNRKAYKGLETQLVWLKTQKVLHQYRYWRSFRDHIIELYNYEKWQNGTLKLTRGMDWSKND